MQVHTGGQTFREAWIAGVKKHYPGTPKPSYISPWADMPNWEQQSATAVYDQVRHFIATSGGAASRLTRAQKGRFVALCWIAQIFKHVPDPKPAYVADWDELARLAARDRRRHLPAHRAGQGLTEQPAIMRSVGRAKLRWALATIGVAALAALAACGSDGAATPTTCPPPGVAMAAAITRPPSPAGPPGGIAGLQAASRNGDQAETLYQTACRLVAVNDQPPPHSAIACPADFGVVYNIVFSSPKGRLATAQYDATGCQTLSMTILASGGHPSTWILGTRAPELAPPFQAAIVDITGQPIVPRF